jgi:tRNA-dihydrouridine synthase
VTVHGRTRQQGFSGAVDLEIIAEVKQAVDVPVIGNGDVVDIASLERMLEVTGCDGVMIGRAALGNPWIFERLLCWWRGQTPPPLPSPADRVQMYLHHLDLYLQIADRWHAVMEMRKWAGWYLRGFPGAASLRKAIYKLEAPEAIRQLVHDTVALVVPQHYGI